MERLTNRSSILSDIIYGKEFKDEMLRFLPTEVQEKTLLNKKFLNILESNTRELLDNFQG